MGCSPSHQDRRQSESQMDGQSLWSLSWRLGETGQTRQLVLRGEFYWNENNFKPGIYTETKAG